MSARTWPFPLLDADALAQSARVAACARLGIDLHWQPRPESGAMLCFDVHAAGIRLRLAMAADTWAPAMLPALSDLAWSALLDADTLRCWLPDTPLLTFDTAVLAAADVHFVEVRPASSAGTASSAQPCVTTAQGPAWIEQVEGRGSTRGPGIANAVQLPVTLEISRRVLPLHRLRALRAGAVLLLDDLVPTARCGDRPLYTFDFTLETISVNTPLDFLDDDAGDLPGAPSLSPAAPSAARFDAAQLPVTVEVVLCTLPQRVGDLDGLLPGTVFALPPDAWSRLELRVHGQTVARGELVQVGDQLGVQLHQAPARP